jgi:hypothetical protein
MTTLGTGKVALDRSAVVLIAAGALLAGCGGETRTSRPDITGTDFPAEVAEATCANIAPCCRAADLPFDEPRCRQAVTSAFSELGFPQVQGRISGSGKCLDALVDSSQACTSNSGCNEAYGGLSRTGGKAGDPCGATCTRLPDIGVMCNSVGTQESASLEDCHTNDGLFCSEESGTCQRRLAPGSPCTDGFACEGGLCVDKRCRSGIDGAPCGNAVHVFCGHGFYCAASTGLCHSILPNDEPCSCTRLKLDGEPCADSVECALGSCNSGTCNPPQPLTPKALELTCQ